MSRTRRAIRSLGAQARQTGTRTEKGREKSSDSTDQTLTVEVQIRIRRSGPAAPQRMQRSGNAASISRGRLIVVARGMAAAWAYTTAMWQRITVSADQMGGVPCIRGLRLPVATVVALVAEGLTREQIIAELPDLEPEDITEALRYAAAALRERQTPVVGAA